LNFRFYCNPWQDNLREFGNLDEQNTVIKIVKLLRQSKNLWSFKFLNLNIIILNAFNEFEYYTIKCTSYTNNYLII